MRTRSAGIVLAAAASVLLAGCGLGPAPTPTTTGLAVDGGGRGDNGGTGGGDPFPPETPTTIAGWKARYQNLPWLADDVDNDDFFVTGSADGHEVMGFFCGYDGNPSGSALGVDGTYVAVAFQSASDVDVDARRGDYLTFTGIGSFALPAEVQGTHEVVPAFATSLQVDSTPGHETSAPTTAAVSFDFLGVPIPDADTCDRESSSLLSWVRSEFGY